MGATGETERNRLNTMGANTRIMSSKDMRKLVVTIAIVALPAFARLFKHLWDVARKICVSPAMVQCFVF